MKNKFYSTKFTQQSVAEPNNYHLTEEEFNHCEKYYDKLADLVINHEAHALPTEKLKSLLGMLFASYTDWTKDLLSNNIAYLTQLGIQLENSQNIGFNLYEEAHNHNLCNMMGMNINYFINTLSDFDN